MLQSKEKGRDERKTLIGRGKDHPMSIQILDSFALIPAQRDQECHFRMKLVNVTPVDLGIGEEPAALPSDLIPGIYIEDVFLLAPRDKQDTKGVGHNHHDGPAVDITSTVPYASLDDVPYLVKENFKILSRALFDTDGGLTHAYSCLRGHSAEFYQYMLLQNITDANLFDFIR